MTDKQQKIVDAACELFSAEGFDAVATSKIAKHAGVSEGLIFRHFENKKGLLNALMLDAEKRIAQLFGPVLFSEDPKEIIRLTLELPFAVPPSEYDYWKLQYKLKWKPEYFNPDKMKPVVDKLEWAFEKLGYDSPAEEALHLELTLDGMAMRVLQGGKEQVQGQLKLLKSKYKV